MQLTQQECRQLGAIKELYPWAKWVARDKDDDLFLYDIKPIKPIGYYSFERKKNAIYSSATKLQCDILSSLTWESEPLNIDEALEGRENRPDNTEKIIKIVVDELIYQGRLSEDEVEEFTLGLVNSLFECGRRLGSK